MPEKNKVGGQVLSVQEKVLLVKTEHGDRVESLKIDPHTYSQLIFCKEKNNNIFEKLHSFNK
jgi:hypothetical protein